MKRILELFIFIFSLQGQTNGQSINLIIQINDKLVMGGLTQIRFVVGADKGKLGNYVPGDLTLTKEIWNEINSDSSKKLFLYFDYNTYSKDKHNVDNFYVELNRLQLSQPYLILDIYDFKDKKYRHWYQYYTDKAFLTHLTFPGSGMLIRQK